MQPGILSSLVAKGKKATTKFNGIFELLSVAENLLTNLIDNCSTEKKQQQQQHTICIWRKKKTNQIPWKFVKCLKSFLSATSFYL